jgi:hypothetical protein
VLVLVLVLYRVVVVDLSWSCVRCFALGLGVVRCFWYGKEKWGLVYLSRCFYGLRRIIPDSYHSIGQHNDVRVGVSVGVISIPVRSRRPLLVLYRGHYSRLLRGDSSRGSGVPDSSHSGGSGKHSDFDPFDSHPRLKKGKSCSPKHRWKRRPHL